MAAVAAWAQSDCTVPKSLAVPHSNTVLQTTLGLPCLQQGGEAHVLWKAAAGDTIHIAYAQMVMQWLKHGSGAGVPVVVLAERRSAIYCTVLTSALLAAHSSSCATCSTGTSTA